MATFSYKIITPQNKIREGSIKARSRITAERKLKADGSTILFVLRDRTHSWFRKEIPLKGLRFSKPEQIIFFRNFGAMTSAGLPMTNALRVLEEQAHSLGLKKVIRTILADIENGQKLSASMRRHPKFFSEYIIETINVGEVTGRLSDTLDRIATDLEANYELYRKVVGAMIYPIIIVIVMLAVVIGMVTIVLPKIASLFAEARVDLPLTTRVLLYGSSFIREHPILLISIAIGFIALIVALFRTKRGRYVFHTVFLHIPLFGGLIREFNLAQFFRALESLVASGLSVVRSVEVASKTLKNEVFKKALIGLHVPLLHGSPLSEALQAHPHLFPTQARRMLEVGENTGKLDEMFLRLMNFYDRAVRHKTQTMSSLIEPILILVIGVVIGGLAVSIFLPIYQISSAIK